MADVKTGLTDAIRKVLAEADDSLTAREVADLVEAAGVPAGNTCAILRQRKLIGEFIQTEIRGQLAYTLNPEFEQIKSGPKRGRPPRTDANPAPQQPKPVAAKPSLAPTPPPRPSTLPPKPIEPVQYQRVPAPEIDPALQVEQAAITAEPSPEPAPRRRPPLALGDRLDAIANDLEEAIADACDAHLAHELIKALVLASGATHRALQKLAA